MELKVWHIINPPRKPKYYKVESVREGHNLIDKLAKKDLFKRHIWGNAFGLEIKENNEWEEWYCNKCGEGIEEHFNRCDNRE